MFQRIIRTAIYALILGAVSGAHAQVDMPKIAKGQLLPAPKYARMLAGSAAQTLDISILFEENFETGASLWAGTGTWAIGAPTIGPAGGHSSLNCAATGLSANYSNNANCRLSSPTIDLPALAHPSTELKISFWEWFTIESGYDHGIVEISTDGGTSWHQLDDRSGSSGWRQIDIDITAYAGQSVKLGFHFTSDVSVAYAGWFLDDVEITKQEPQPLTATLSSLNHQNFPFIYMNVAVDTFNVGYPGLTQSAFRVFENGVLQTDYFEVTPPDASGGARLADVVFVMDNSGSMVDEQNAIYNNLIAFVNALSSSGIDFALGLCRYGASANSGYPIIEDNGILTSDANYFKNTVWLRNTIDGVYEPGWDALYGAANSFSFRPGSQKIFVLITDESPNYVTGGASSNFGVYTQAATQTLLQAQTVTLFTLIPLVSAVIQDYGSIAEATNGDYFDIYSPFDDILTYIESQVSNTYLVRYRSSNPVSDGTLRTVRTEVSYNGNAAMCDGSYIPGSAPVIQRTQATLDLHTRAWAEGTAFTIEADIIDNIAPYVQSATVYYKATNVSQYSSVAMAPYSGNTYRASIPASAVRNPGLDYYITATDGQTTSSDPRNDAASNPYQLGILPNVAPVITHTPVTTLTPGSPITINADIIDNTNLLSAGRLHYRKIGQLLYQQAAMTSMGGNSYQSVIPASFVTRDGVEYYLYAVDNFGVSSTHGSADDPHKIEPLYDLGFRANPDGWRFSNSSVNMWPQVWWNQFNYCGNPYPLGWCALANSSDFPDWPLFVEAFGQDACYLNPPPGLIIYDPRAVLKWFGVKGTWGGSCFGFAISSFLYFDNFLSLSALFPGNPNVYAVPIQDDSRRLINIYFLYQFGKNQLAHINASDDKAPVTTLNEIKQMCLSTVRDDRILTFFNQNPSPTNPAGGHAVNPYKVGVGERVDTVYIYDNNAPNTARRIYIDKVSNNWDYPEMPNWGGQRGLFLMDPVGDYMTRPLLPIQVPPRERHITESSVDPVNYAEIYNSECDVSIVGVTGDSIGYRQLTGSPFSTFHDGMPIIPITGFAHPPIGYFLPVGSYEFRLSNFADTAMYISVLEDSSAFAVNRGAAKQNHVDELSVDVQAATVRLFNADLGGKSYSIQSVIVGPDGEKVFGINRCNVAHDDTLITRVEGHDRLKVSNNGSDKNYDVLLKLVSRSDEQIFEHRNLSLLRNSVHLIVPQWNKIGDQELSILIDEDMDGTWDDTLFVENQYADNGSPPTPGPLSNQNIYAFPNPFNPDAEHAEFRFKLGRDGGVTITVYDSSNKKVKEVISAKPMSAGVEQSVPWNGRNDRGDIVGNGIYFYIIESSSGERAIGKIAVLR
jgi:hypothetical protein